MWLVVCRKRLIWSSEWNNNYTEVKKMCAGVRLAPKWVLNKNLFYWIFPNYGVLFGQGLKPYQENDFKLDDIVEGVINWFLKGKIWVDF